MYSMKMQKTGTKRKRSPRLPDLSEEIMMEILVWLPVKSLLRFKSVCKAWQNIINDPIFIRAHLRCSASKWEQDPSVIISPQTLDYVVPGERWPSTFSNHVRFYQWHPQGASNDQVAKYLHAKKFSGEFSRLCYFAHCDGLMLTPTDTKLYLFNPATRDAVTLPDSNRRRINSIREACHCAGLGLDPHTGRYKVVQAFYRSIDTAANIYRMGMEVFTINGGGAWREIMDDLPCPIKRWQTGLTFKGFLFWYIDRARHHQRTLRGLLRLSLADESFSVTQLPDSMDGDACVIDVLRGELCLTARTTSETVTVWAMAIDDNGSHGPWEQRYAIQFPRLCHPMALLPGGCQVLFWNHLALYGYDLATSKMTTLCEMDCMGYEGRRARTWKNLNNFNVRPYTESLVRITA